ncbi:MAG: cupin domain-containing protein [Oscillospiraceae bacterium]|nr:cupin domain-containing protein [Oscillospiraceae bacterium]
MENLEIGAKIKKYRTEKRFSLKTLAEKVNITPSMLSQIEHDQANPSINTLKLISAALNVPLYQFFTTTNNVAEDVVVRKGQRKKILSSGNNSFEYELLTPDNTGTIEFVLQRFKPNSNSGDAVQSHEGEEVFYVLKGTLVLFLDKLEVTLNEGDSVRIPARTPHFWVNQTDSEVEVIFAITPPAF